jgi:RNA polymerase sigma factor (sigma-70 family)
VSAELDGWLCRRAAEGDGAAFDKLLATHKRKLLNVCASYAESGIDQDDLFQMVSMKVWVEVQRGHYNPHRADLSAFWSTVAYQVLRDDRQRRRAQKRWSTEPPASMDVLVELDLEPRSFSIGEDPLTIVIQRETLRESIQAMTRGQLAAVNSYLLSGGIGEPANVVTAFAGARKRARPFLAAMQGSPLRLV